MFNRSVLLVSAVRLFISHDNPIPSHISRKDFSVSLARARIGVIQITLGPDVAVEKLLRFSIKGPKQAAGKPKGPNRQLEF